MADRQYFISFLELFDYPEEARKELLWAYDRIHQDAAWSEEFKRLLKCYAENNKCEFSVLQNDIDALSEKAGLHKYTGSLVLLICMSDILKGFYAEAGYSEEMWYAAMNDLKYKLMECKGVRGVWGIFVFTWFQGFFTLSRFGFGKLQFNLSTFGRIYHKNGLDLKPDSTVVTVHIPRTGTRLDRESVLQSYKQAAEFYKDLFKGGPVIFTCDSWLLFPRHKEVLSPQSNIYAFISDFDLVSYGEYDDYSQVWRLFNTSYNGNVDDLPQNTSLQRIYAEWIRNGEKTGWGYGVFAYD